MFIRSQRLFLRPPWSEDADELFAAINDPAVVRNLARAPWPYGLEDAQQFSERQREDLFPEFLVTVPTAAGASIIGGAGLARNGADTELGYWLSRPYWGQGYATEAARAVLEVAKGLGHRKVTAMHFADNQRSGRVLRKLGFALVERQAKRFSRGRGESVPAMIYSLALESSRGGDGDGGADDRMAA